MEAKEKKPMGIEVEAGFIAFFFFFSLVVRCSTGAPIRAPDFATCVPANYPNSLPGGQTKTVSCCPPLSKTPPLDFKPPRVCTGQTENSVDGDCKAATSMALRVRPAVQCADSTYAWKLNRAYELMRALPDDDPRSLMQQANSHCAYCGGAFLQTGSSEAIDIHYSWLFYPWHRMFLHFHERILQSLLNDTSFSIPFWNWDNQLPPGGGNQSSSSTTSSCRRVGNLFPQFYSDPSSSLFDANRNPQHAESDAVIDLSYLTTRSNSSAQPLSPDLQVASNLNVMHQTMVSGGTTAETFLGAVYRAGNPRPRILFSSPGASGGTLELGPHVSTHFWVAQDTSPYLDFAAPWISAYDPVFYAHHANVDRLWTTWKSLGRADYDDPDWLDAEFLFYDETGQLVRVKVSDALSTQDLGYVYESVDNSWEDYNATRCGTVDAQDMLQELQRIPQEYLPGGRRITLSSGGIFNAVVKRKPTTDRTDDDHEEMLVIHDIRLDPTSIAHFDVFLNLPGAGMETQLSCAEYVGRFNYLPLPSSKNLAHRRRFKWKIGIARTLRDLRMDTLPSALVTLVSPSGSASELSFRKVTIERSK